ncbi:unnamed protein product [Rangifer tarandus platyrhynchus]|uniref:Uncharacterized protein n=1 Tax=Rangifer tarandus platyrhynchus TaxID=3082113 RepID=A0AC60A517_RANTA
MQASAAAAHRLSGCGPGLWRTDLLRAAAHGLSCSMVCGIFPDQRSNPRLLHWQADSLPLATGAPSSSVFEETSDFGVPGSGLGALCMLSR